MLRAKSDSEEGPRLVGDGPRAFTAHNDNALRTPRAWQPPRPSDEIQRVVSLIPPVEGCPLQSALSHALHDMARDFRASGLLNERDLHDLRAGWTLGEPRAWLARLALNRVYELPLDY